MRGSLLPSAKRLINSVAPLNPNDFSEVNALNVMFITDNISTGEFLEDSSILARHLSQLRAREQVTPNLTLEVAAGTATFSTTLVIFAGGNTPNIPAPATNPRIDLICINSSGVITRTAGVEAVSPVTPALPAASIPLCSVFCRVGMVRIRDNDTQEAGQGYVLVDLRPYFGQGGSMIKNVQRGTSQIAITGGGGGGTYQINTMTNNITLTAIDRSKAFYNISYYISAQTPGSRVYTVTHSVRGELTSTTNLALIGEAFLLSGDAMTLEVSWEVVEYL